MADGNVPNRPSTSEVRQAGERMRDGAEAAVEALLKRQRQEEELRRATDEANRRKGESSKQ